MKRILALILTIATLLVLTACGASSSKESGKDSNVYSLGDTVSTDVMEFTLDMAEFAIAAHDGTAGDYNDICLPKEFDAERDDNASFVAALGHTLICYQFTIKNLDRVTLPIVESSLDVFVTAAYNGETYDCDNNGFYESADSYDWGCEGDFLSVEAQTTTHYRSTASIAVEAENFTDSFSLTFSLPTSSGETKDFTFEVTSADIEKQKQVEPTLDEAVAHFTYDKCYKYFETHINEYKAITEAEISKVISTDSVNLQLKGDVFAFNQKVSFDGNGVFTYYYKNTPVSIPYSVSNNALTIEMSTGNYVCEVRQINDTAYLLVCDGAPFGVLYY